MAKNSFFDSFSQGFNKEYDAAEESRRDLLSYKKKHEWQSEFETRQAELETYKKTRTAMTSHIKSLSSMLDISNQDAARMIKGKSVDEIEGTVSSIRKMYDSGSPLLQPLKQKYFSSAPSDPNRPTQAWDPGALADILARDVAPLPSPVEKKPTIADSIVSSIGSLFSSGEEETPVEAAPEQTSADIGESIRFEPGELTPDVVAARKDVEIKRRRDAETHAIQIEKNTRDRAKFIQEQEDRKLSAASREVQKAAGVYFDTLNDPTVPPEQKQEAEVAYTTIQQNFILSSPELAQEAPKRYYDYMTTSIKDSADKVNMEKALTDPLGWFQARTGTTMISDLKIGTKLKQMGDRQEAILRIMGLDPKSTQYGDYPIEALITQVYVPKYRMAIAEQHQMALYRSSAVYDPKNRKVLHKNSTVLLGMPPEERKVYDVAFENTYYLKGLEGDALVSRLQRNISKTVEAEKARADKTPEAQAAAAKSAIEKARITFELTARFMNKSGEFLNAFDLALQKMQGANAQ